MHHFTIRGCHFIDHESFTAEVCCFQNNSLIMEVESRAKVKKLSMNTILVTCMMILLKRRLRIVLLNWSILLLSSVLEQPKNAEAALNRRDGVNVAFQISPEPLFMLKHIITFECCLNNKWERVGYMVTDVLSAVHEALHKQEIVTVELAWVKFITHWSQSSPGWYCGVKISKKGPWSNDVWRCRSTI